MNRKDPTGTRQIRKSFSSEFYKRYRWLKGQVRKKIIEDKFFSETGFSLVHNVTNAQYEEFTSWIDGLIEGGIILSKKKGFSNSIDFERWSDIYVHASYKKGMKDAYQFGNYRKKTGIPVDSFVDSASFDSLHRETMNVLFQKTFSEIKGVARATQQKIQRVVAKGALENSSFKEIASQINKEIDKVGLYRSRLIAQTEIVRAHAEASLNIYKSFGEEFVGALVEFSTVGDEKVCSICSALNGKLFTIEEARGLIPLHPFCRCVWLPMEE